MNDPLDVAKAWLAAGQGVALATVVETWGSAPRPAGSLMVCNSRGEFAGSVSGGCVEVAVIEAALEVCAGRGARVLEFGVTDEQAWSVGLACGGRIRVLVTLPSPALIDALLAARTERRAVVHAQALDGSTSALLEADASDDAASVLRSDQARVVTLSGRETLLTPHNPPLRLFIVGAVHIAESLCAIARLAGHEVTLIDPRSAFLRPTLFPGVVLDDRWPQQALGAASLDARCAAVLLSHDPKIDDPALHLLLGAPAYYIGALGSRRTHAKRVERLAAAGFPPEAIARIRGPAGLAIGARTPAEIAVSVFGEMVASLRQPAVGAG